MLHNCRLIARSRRGRASPGTSGAAWNSATVRLCGRRSPGPSPTALRQGDHLLLRQRVVRPSDHLLVRQMVWRDFPRGHRVQPSLEVPSQEILTGSRAFCTFRCTARCTCRWVLQLNQRFACKLLSPLAQAHAWKADALSRAELRAPGSARRPHLYAAGTAGRPGNRANRREPPGGHRRGQQDREAHNATGHGAVPGFAATVSPASRPACGRSR